VAKASSPAATFSARLANGTQFRALGSNAELYTGDLLIVLPGGTFTTSSGAMGVKSLANFDTQSRLPIFETAVVLHETPKSDLDLTLDRGRIEITNTKATGSVSMTIRFCDQVWKVVLESPNDRIAFEYSSRWPEGTRLKTADAGSDFTKAPAPLSSLVCVLLSGSASVDVGGVTVALKAPPGPAELNWNSLTGARAQPLKREKPPSWATGDRLPKMATAVEKFRKARADNPARAWETFLASSDPVEQHIALVSLGSFDDLDALGKALLSAKTMADWDAGVIVLRHWLGRCRGQDQRYYELLTTTRGYSPAEAKTILQLLFGFSADELSLPETYEVLIDYLVHEKPAIRNLAAWNLARLVPQGESIAYRPDGSAADAEAAQAAWKKLIPRGQLPAKVKKE